MQLFPWVDLHSEDWKNYSTELDWPRLDLTGLTALPETPEAGSTVPGNPEGSSALLVLSLGAGQAAAALVQRVEPGVTADRCLAGRTSTGAGEALSQGHTWRRRTLRTQDSKLLTFLTSQLTTPTTGSCSLLGSQEATE